MTRLPLLPAVLLERFEPRRTLGEGGFGVVVLAWDRQLSRLVALKLLKGSLPELSQRYRFEREARVTASFRHANVVGLYDLGVFEDGSAWIAYEYVEGRDLSQVVAAEVPGIGRVRAWAGQLADALDLVHAAGLIHRDIKPQNLLIRPDDQAVLCDFGLARKERGGTQVTAEGLILGTPAYLGPEVYRGHPPDRRTDQFALAATLYQALYGQLAYPGPEVTVILGAVSAGWRPVVPPAGKAGHPGGDEALARALDPDPDRRFSTLKDFLAAWDREPLPARAPTKTRLPAVPTSPDPPPVAAARDRGWLRLLVLGVLLCVGAGARPWGWFQGARDAFPARAAPPAQARADIPPGVARAGLDSEYPSRLRSEFEQAKLWRRGASGEVLKASASVDLPGSEEFLSQDPLDWWTIVAGLPEVRYFYRWLAAGGDPQDLPEALKRELREVDQRYEQEGLTPPFGVLLDLVGVAEARELPRSMLTATGVPELENSYPDRVEGRNAGLAGLVGALAETERRDDVALDFVVPEDPDLAAAWRGIQAVGSSGDFVASTFRSPRTRPAIARALGPGRDQVLALLVLASRAIQRPQERPELATLLLRHGLAGFAVRYFRTDLARFPVEWFYPQAGEQPVRLGFGAALIRQLQVKALETPLTEQPDLVPAFRAAYQLEGEGPLAPYRRGTALAAWLQELRARGDGEAMVALYRRTEAKLEELPVSYQMLVCSRLLLHLYESWSHTSSGLDQEQALEICQRLRALIREHPEPRRSLLLGKTALEDIEIRLRSSRPPR